MASGEIEREGGPRFVVVEDDAAAARAAARHLAESARTAIAARGGFACALSGGSTPWRMIRALAGEPVDWSAWHVFQVDERIAPDGHADRNLSALTAVLEEVAPAGLERVRPMPVGEPDPDVAARAYAQTLAATCGTPPVLDLVHLGLGADGHTASLVPDDPVLDVDDADVAVTGLYQGRRRLTLTYRAIARAREILWLATGAGKAEMLARLAAGDVSIPAGRVPAANAVVIADTAAASGLPAAR